MTGDPQGLFFLRPAVVRWIVWLLYCLCAASVLLDVVIHRHEYFGFAGLFGFYAGFGLIACVALVLVAKLMRRVLIRNEDYYPEGPPS